MSTFGMHIIQCPQAQSWFPGHSINHLTA